jgi:hypothetical protein
MSAQNAMQASIKDTRKALILPFTFTLIFVALGFASPARSNPHVVWTFIGIGAFLLGWELKMFLSHDRNAGAFQWEFVPMRSHYIQALVQFSVYAYWGWYWRDVYHEAPLILSQVAFVYVLDALVTWARGRTWRLGFGPWPIIFSTNLFMWFKDDWFYFQFLMVAVGVLGKQFIVWKRDGKLTHVFNPSAFGLTVVSLVLIFSGSTGITWGPQIAATQGRPPHLYLEIFLGGLIVQYFFSVTLLTFSAAAALAALSLAYTKLTGVYLFFDTNIPIAVFLGLHLLMTDPATTPRSSLGKILFGAAYGCGVFGAELIFSAFNVPGFYDKLVIVPILNLTVSWFDRAAAWKFAAKFDAWEKIIGARRANLVFIGSWAGLFIVMLTTGFVEGPHPGKTIAFWEKAAEQNRPNAVKNLRFLLEKLDQRDLDAMLNGTTGVDENSRMSSRQALGIMCDQAASIYAQGKFVPADADKAARYFEKGCEFGNSDACAHLAVEYFHTNQSFASADIVRALSTLEKSGAATGDGKICCILAYACNAGRGLPQDKPKARQYYEKGAVLGEVAAWKGLARMLLAGEGGPPDHESAAAWLQKGADLQDGESCLYLAKLYHTGDGVRQDEQKAVGLLKKACDLGVEPACLLLRETQPHLSKE